MGPTKKKKRNDGHAYKWFNLVPLFLYTINVSQMNNSRELVCTHSLNSLRIFLLKSHELWNLQVILFTWLNSMINNVIQPIMT